MEDVVKHTAGAPDTLEGKTTPITHTEIFFRVKQHK